MERRIRAGNGSTAQVRCILFTPLAKKCSTSVAKRAHVRLIAKAKNQSEFAKTAHRKTGGTANMEGMDAWGIVLLRSAIDVREIEYR